MSHEAQSAEGVGVGVTVMVVSGSVVVDVGSSDSEDVGEVVVAGTSCSLSQYS